MGQLQKATITDAETEAKNEIEMLNLEPERLQPPKFPYEKNQWLSVPDIESIIKRDKVWSDNRFMADKDAIFSKKITARLEQKTLPEKFWINRSNYEQTMIECSWQRPTEVYQSLYDFSVMKSVNAQDIEQGLLGDCYFLSALSALAEDNSRIKKLFITQETNYAGLYAVKLFVNGEEQVVVVDDQFPFDDRPEKDQWAMGHVSRDWEIWVNIIEKAYAKVLGSYEAIEGGKANQAFSLLTGFPCDCLEHRNYSLDELWSIVLPTMQTNQPATCAVNNLMNGMSKDQLKSQGLTNGHAYTLLDARVVNDPLSNKKARLLKIRNPYGDEGHQEWKGKWSDNSKEMSEEVRIQLYGSEQKVTDDGSFWIEMDDYFKFFYSTTICHYKPNYKVCTLADTHSMFGHAVSRLDVEEDIVGLGVTFTLSQMHKRYATTWPDSTYQYAPMQIYLARVDREFIKNPKGSKNPLFRDSLKLVDGARDNEGIPVVYFQRTKLRKGRYILFYRAAFNTLSEGEQGQEFIRGGKPVKKQLYVHESHKLVLGCQVPQDAQIKLTKVNTKFYNKDLFLEMKTLYISKFEAEAKE